RCVVDKEQSTDQERDRENDEGKNKSESNADLNNNPDRPHVKYRRIIDKDLIVTNDVVVPHRRVPLIYPLAFVANPLHIPPASPPVSCAASTRCRTTLLRSRTERSLR